MTKDVALLTEPLMPTADESHQPLSLHTRYLIWRARLSIPVLLSRFEERKVVSLIGAINGAVAILTIGLFAWLTDLPLVFPALGPTAFIQFTTPLAPAASPRNVILGHLSCLVLGYVVGMAMYRLAGGPISIDTSGWVVFTGASVTLALCCLAMVWLRCPHPPACASGLIIVLTGGLSTSLDVALMAAAVIALSAEALLLNRFAGIPVPYWRPRPLSSET